MNRYFIIFISLFAVASVGLRADTLEDSLAKAERLYRDGEFLQAASIYQSLIEQDSLQSGGLYFNLGNALAKAGERGPAVAAMLKARQFLPRDPDVRYNLQFLLQKNRDAVDLARLPVMANLPAGLALSPLELLYTASSVLCIGGLIFGFSWYSRRRFWCLISLFLLLVPGALGLLAASQHEDVWLDWAAVAADEAPIYSSPGQQSGIVLFKLHEGTPVRYIQQEDSRILIELSDQKRGWIDAAQLAVF